jgi:GNAT superfamily N-acetyltransferase
VAVDATPGPFRVEPLGKAHDRRGFTCGVDSLDAYLKTQAGQDLKRRANAVLVMVAPAEPTTVLGYFTLCATALAPGDVPEAASRYLARYPLVSATLIGRLAIASSWQGRGLGSILLANALRRCHESAAVVGSSMVVVDAIDDRAARFYEAHGFVPLPDSKRLVLPMRSIEECLR